MNIEIITTPLQLDVYGYQGTAVNKNYTATAFALMDKMWQVVKTNKLPNKGLNIWVYEQDEKVFAGVELNDTPNASFGLELKSITLTNYARYTHIGAYNLIKQAGANMTAALKSKGFEVILPYIEIYGHWTNDETKLETTLIMCLK